MQTKKTKQAHRAKAGKTGNTGSTGNTRTTGKTSKSKLTEAQRIAKRVRDRKYRERIRGAKAVADGPDPRFGAGPNCAGAVPRIEPPRAAGANDVFSIIGRLVVRELARGGLPCPTRSSAEVEPGVLQQEVTLPNGMHAKVVLVDVDKVDPLSERSTLPAPIRMHLLRQRMAREISDIVDSHVELP